MGYESGNLDELVAAAQSARIEMRQTGIASVMFTDVVDSTALASALGDTAWSKVVKDHLARITTEVSQAGGQLVKTLGDGTLSTFPSASGAMKAAQSIHRTFAAQATEPRLRVRIGIHTGDVVQSDGDFRGSVVNKAARVAAMATPDEIRVSEATRVMVGTAPEFEFTDPVHVPLKGLDGEHLIHRLGW
jgi:class 3 adenylate cyclase